MVQFEFKHHSICKFFLETDRENLLKLSKLGTKLQWIKVAKSQNYFNCTPIISKSTKKSSAQYKLRPYFSWFFEEWPLNIIWNDTKENVKASKT